MSVKSSIRGTCFPTNSCCIIARIKSLKFNENGGGISSSCSCGGGGGAAAAAGAGSACCCGGAGSCIFGINPCDAACDNVSTGVAVVVSRHKENLCGCS